MWVNMANPYYWVDDHPLRESRGVDRPLRTHGGSPATLKTMQTGNHQTFQVPKMEESSPI